MNAPFFRQPNPWADFERAEAERKARSAERVARAFETATKELRERFGEPRVWTPEELAELASRREAEARERADAAARKLFGDFIELSDGLAPLGIVRRVLK